MIMHDKRYKRSHVVLAGLASTALIVALSGCSMFSGIAGSSSSASSSGNSNANIVVSTSQAYEITLGAQNAMCDNALQFTVTNMERRPISTFINASSSSNSNSSSSASVSSSSSNTNVSDDTNKVAVEVDVSYTFNQTTLTTNMQQYGNTSSSSTPSTLSDILLPGQLMYITGTDSDGNAYVASDILSVKSNTSSNTLGTNAQWDYDVLNSSLPQATQTKTGSMIFIVSNSAQNLQLHIITGMNNASPLDAAAVGSGNNYHYVLDLS